MTSRRLLARPCMLFPLVSAVGLLISVFALAADCGAENGVTAGYGFGVWNGSGTGRIEKKLTYDYAMLSYLYEKPITAHMAFVIEPYCNIVNRPNSGVDVGFSTHLKAYIAGRATRSWYLSAGAGAAYTTIAFSEQGTHGLFVLQAAAGYRYDNFFVENRFHHYSNANLAWPNRSVNSNLIRIGYYF